MQCETYLSEPNHGAVENLPLTPPRSEFTPSPQSHISIEPSQQSQVFYDPEHQNKQVYTNYSHFYPDPSSYWNSNYPTFRQYNNDQFSYPSTNGFMPQEINHPNQYFTYQDPNGCNSSNANAINYTISKQFQVSSVAPPKVKQKRVFFSPEQLQELERSFASTKYLNRVDRVNLSVKLGLTEKQVKIWFQNKRTKHRKNSKDVRVTNVSNKNHHKKFPIKNESIKVEKIFENDIVPINKTVDDCVEAHLLKELQENTQAEIFLEKVNHIFPVEVHNILNSV